MKVINKTPWRTADLKRILLRCAALEFDEVPTAKGISRQKLVVTVVPSRRHPATGYAWYHTHKSVLRILSPHRIGTEAELLDLKLHFAKVACHEFAHNRGQRHGRMPAYLRWKGDWKARVAWVTDLPLEAQTKKTVPIAARVDARRQHVEQMLVKAETRLKRAKTIRDNWLKKKRYYEAKERAAVAALRTESE